MKIAICNFGLMQRVKKIKISMNEFCPYHCHDSEGKWDKEFRGYAYEMYDEIYTNAGYDFKAMQNPFHRGMLSTDTGIVDAVSGPIKITSKKELTEKNQTKRKHWQNLREINLFRRTYINVSLKLFFWKFRVNLEL